MRNDWYGAWRHCTEWCKFADLCRAGAKMRNTMQYNNIAVDDTIMAAFEKIVQVHRVLIWDSAKI